MKNKNGKTIHVQWVRSGIGFSYRQKAMVRSLGLRRLNQVVELEDNPCIRGLAAKIPHLVEIVAAPRPAPAVVPEFTVRAPRPEAAEQSSQKTRKASRPKRKKASNEAPEEPAQEPEKSEE